MNKHIVLLGDSIFDNAIYVPGEDAVIDQLRAGIPTEWQATLLAVDGDITVDVAEQLKQSPADATDFVISVGGNDAQSDPLTLGLRQVHRSCKAFLMQEFTAFLPVGNSDRPNILQ